MRAIAISELESRFSEYVHGMEAGANVLVTELGRVVVELHKPVADPDPAERYPGLAKLAEQGELRLGLPNDPSLYPPRPVRSPAGLAVRLLDEEREER